MLFSTAEARETFFELAAKSLVIVNYGSAIEHASTTKLGVFGSRSMLEQDVAQIMAHEVERFAMDHEGVNAHVDPMIIQHLPNFRAAYAAARAKQEGVVNAMLIEVATAAGNNDILEPATRALNESNAIPPFDATNLHRTLYRDWKQYILDHDEE